MHTTTKVVANAFRNGMQKAYSKKLRPKQRRLFCEMLDDMAVALTEAFVIDKEESLEKSAWVLGAILEDMDPRPEKTTVPKKERLR